MKPAEQLLLLAGAIAAYIATFFVSYPLLGAGVVGFSVVMPIVGGWITGLRGGIASGLAMFPVNVALLLMQGEAGMYVMTHGGLTGTIILVVIGGVVGHLHDLQGRLRGTEEKYRWLSRFHEEVLNHSPAGILRLDEDLHIVYENPQMKELRGVPAGEESNAIGIDIRELGSVQKAGVADVFNQLLQGEKIQGEIPFVSIYGKETFLSFSGAPIMEENTFTGAVVLINDITQRKEAQRAVEESEEKYRSLVENLNVGVYRNTPGPKGEFVEANQAIVSMFGYDNEEEFKNIQVADLYQHPEDRKRFSEKLSQQGYVRNEELKLQKKDGTPFWGSVTAIAVTDDDGHIQYYDGIIEDITRRKRAEQKLQESEEKYRSIVENAQAGILIVREDYRFIYVNDRLCEILGYPEEELIGEDFRTFLDEESRELVADRYKKRQRGEDVPSRYEFNIVRKKGEKRRVEISSTVITDVEGKKKTVAQILDITERKEAERRYRSVVEHAHDAIYTIHPQRGFQYVNPAFEELTGYPASEIYSDAFSFWDIIHPDDVPLIEKRGKARERGEAVPDRYEFRIIAKDGATKTLEATTVDIGTGDAPLVMGILRDVTERERAYREMERALQLEKRFKADAAHFFLNPIAITKGYMELAMEEMPEGCKKKIKSSRDAIKRVETVIKNIVEKGEIHE